MEDKHILTWKDRLRLCWDICIWGKYDKREYKTVYEKEQLEICRKRQAELDACCRPKTYPKIKGKLLHTDYYERNDQHGK